MNLEVKSNVNKRTPNRLFYISLSSVNQKYFQITKLQITPTDL